MYLPVTFGAITSVLLSLKHQAVCLCDKLDAKNGTFDPIVVIAKRIDVEPVTTGCRKSP